MKRIPNQAVGWFVVAMIILAAVCFIGAAVSRPWSQPEKRGQAEPGVVDTFRPVRGVVGLKGPVAIQEQDDAGQVKRVDVMGKDRDIRVRVKDSKGKVISETKIDSKANAKGRS